jgi:outer membrane protein insertion porin family/translocation and assembly module TamA
MPVRAFARAVRLCVCVATLIGVSACKEEGGVKVTRLDFEGMRAVDPDRLKSVLATASSSRLPWGERRYFSREAFEADVKRIVAFYQDRGFPDARVSSFDVDLSPDQSSVAITVRISEGEPIRVERVELDGFESLRPRRRQSLDARLALKPGQPLDRALLQASREAALDELKESGYPYASVRIAEKPGAGERSRVVALVAQPGTLAYHGPIEMSGNSSVADNVVQRQMTFRPGQVYRHSRLLESQRRLYALEVFDFANVEALRKEGEQPVEIPTRVTVTEGKHRKMNLGIGYGSEERARVQADWRHVNFFGGARTAGVLGRYSSLDRGIKLNFTQPYLFSPRYSFSMSGQYWHNEEPAFRLDNVGGRMTITRQFARAGASGFRTRPATTLSFTYANEWEQFEIDPETLEDLTQRDELISIGLDPTAGGVGTGQRSAISFDAGRNTTGNILDARRGYVASLHLEQAGKWLQGDYNYYELTGEGRFYRTIAGRAVVAVRARAGSIEPLGREFTGDELSAIEIGVPFHKRYFLGGSTNLRGWGRFDVAPLSGAGLPLGGHAFMDFSTEVRVPVWGNLGAVIFLDGGNVWSRPWDVNVNDLRYDVGPGIRYNTPIGPIRADLGYQLNPIPGLLVNGKPETRRFRFHFSIGQAF